MTRWNEPLSDCCERIRRLIDEQFDRAAPDHMDAAVADHLSQCNACRQYHQRLKAFEEDMRSLPTVPFPKEALEAVLAETVDLATTATWQWSWRRWGRRLVAAAVLALSVTIPWTAWQLHLSAQQERIDEAVSQTRYVLGVTAGAFHRVETVAVDDVYGEHLSSALRRLNVVWSSKPFMYIRLGD